MRILGALEEAGIRAFCDVNKSDREIHLPNGSEFLFVGADNPEKLKSIEAITDWWLEEATEYDEADFDTIDAGLSAFCEPPPAIWLSFNPIPVIEGVPHWLQRRFFTGVDPELGELVVNNEAVILRTYFMHNAYCPDATKRVLRAYQTSNPELWRMWGLGEFTRMKGAIIKQWDRVDGVPEGVNEIGYGLDFGFAIDPAAVVQVWQKPGHLWLKQMLYETELTNQELSEYMEVAGLERGYSDIIADSAEPKSIRELQQMGWLVSGARKHPGYKREAALWMRGQFVHVVNDSPKLLEEVATWSWKYNQSADKYMPEPADGADHGIDATIYRAYREQEGILTRDEVSKAVRSDLEPPHEERIEDDDLEVVIGG